MNIGHFKQRLQAKERELQADIARLEEEARGLGKWRSEILPMTPPLRKLLPNPWKREAWRPKHCFKSGTL